MKTNFIKFEAFDVYISWQILNFLFKKSVICSILKCYPYSSYVLVWSMKKSSGEFH